VGPLRAPASRPGTHSSTRITRRALRWTSPRSTRWLCRATLRAATLRARSIGCGTRRWQAARCQSVGCCSLTCCATGHRARALGGRESVGYWVLVSRSVRQAHQCAAVAACGCGTHEEHRKQPRNSFVRTTSKELELASTLQAATLHVAFPGSTQAVSPLLLPPLPSGCNGDGGHDYSGQPKGFKNRRHFVPAVRHTCASYGWSGADSDTHC